MEALSRAEQALVTLSAALAARDDTTLGGALERAAGHAPAAAVEEILLQSYLFLGYPVALEGFAAWRAHAPDAPRARDDRAEWAERGERVCREVYGGQYERLRANVERLHPDMERWMVVEGYGKVLGRPGVELRVRELCVVACLVVLDAPRQLYSHLRGALNAGAAPETVDRTLALALPMAPEAARARALETWVEVRARAAAAREEA